MVHNPRAQTGGERFGLLEVCSVLRSHPNIRVVSGKLFTRPVQRSGGGEQSGCSLLCAFRSSCETPDAGNGIFTHSGHVSDVPKTVYTIGNRSLPDLGFKPIKPRTSNVTITGSILKPVTGRSSLPNRWAADFLKHEVDEDTHLCREDV